jgi:hypothetical protein
MATYGYKCPACKTINPEKVNYCVKCGQWLLDTKFPAQRVNVGFGVGKAIKIFLAGAFSMVVIAVILSVFANKPGSRAISQTTSSKAYYQGSYLVSDYGWKKDNNGHLSYVAKITNEKDSTSGRINMILTFYDANQKLIGQKETGTSGIKLKDSIQATFDNIPQQTKSVKLVVTAQK